METTVHFICIVLFCFFPEFSFGQNVNGTCELDGEKGKCINIQNCTYARDLLRIRIFPKICGFEGNYPVVCCKEQSGERLFLNPGQLSRTKCDEFYPKPGTEADEALVPGAKPSLVKEFPHMAIIGFGEKDKIQWRCGGSLISENFILTAGHCLNSRELGPAKFVRLGDLDISTDTDDAEPQDFTVKRRIPHPEYKPPSRYHDIGLIELDKNIVQSSYVSMACLDTELHHRERQMTATGWGKTQFIGDYSSFLLKIDLDIVGHDECSKSYENRTANELPNGILNEMHICAGGKPKQDTCQGDSGGPLQIRFPEVGPFKNYNIVGVTSFGKACGISRAPGIYTRVYNYLDWIEKIVWVL